MTPPPYRVETYDPMPPVALEEMTQIITDIGRVEDENHYKK